MAGLFDGTDLERPVTCENCGREVDACACAKDATGKVVLPRDQHPRVRREKRRGKWNTVIAGIEVDAKGVLKMLRTELGTGGGMDGRAGGEIVLQGDHREAVVARLRELGYEAKGAGG